MPLVLYRYCFAKCWVYQYHESRYRKINHKTKCSYSLGIPVALKLGNIQTYFITAGIEPEIMFAYKRKLFLMVINQKKSQWFSNDVNVFNPSLFAQINFKGGMYIRVKYYLNDFLTNNTESFSLPEKPVSVSYKKVDSSKLYYISIWNKY